MVRLATRRGEEAGEVGVGHVAHLAVEPAPARVNGVVKRVGDVHPGKGGGGGAVLEGMKGGGDFDSRAQVGGGSIAVARLKQPLGGSCCNWRSGGLCRRWHWDCCACRRGGWLVRLG